MPEPTPEQQIKGYAKKIVMEIRMWMEMREYGCNDPFWPDGCNMNLIHNHIVYYKNEIAALCEEHKLKYPDEYYLPTPPEVDNDFMAETKSDNAKRRLRNITAGNKRYRIITKKPLYDIAQTSMI